MRRRWRRLPGWARWLGEVAVLAALGMAIGWAAVQPPYTP